MPLRKQMAVLSPPPGRSCDVHWKLTHYSAKVFIFDQEDPTNIGHGYFWRSKKRAFSMCILAVSSSFRLIGTRALVVFPNGAVLEVATCSH